MKALAVLAQEEKWDYRDIDPTGDPEDEARNTEFPVLKNYVYYTFARAHQQDKIKISPDAKIAAFNTGLLTDNWQPIYAIFEKNRRALETGRGWVLKGWGTAFDRTLRQLQPQMPPVVTYSEEIEKFLYYPSVMTVEDGRAVRKDLPLIMNKDHIVEHYANVERWPEDLRGPDKLNDRRAFLDAAQARMLDRVARNFKAAVPQCYKGKIQLLMPLCLRDPGRADLALVVEREGEAYYGNTVLKISWAYSNARLICKPESDWLNLGECPLCGKATTRQESDDETVAAPVFQPQERVTGRVLWYDPKKGFGRVMRDNGDSVFVHYSAIREPGLKTLSEGERVEFEVVPDAKGPKAQNVMRLGRVDMQGGDTEEEDAGGGPLGKKEEPL